MSVYRKLLITAILTVSLSISAASDPFQALYSNRIYGYIQMPQDITQQGIYIPVNNLKIDILKVLEKAQPDGSHIRTPGEIVKSTHPDTRGYFSFLDIHEGIYFLQISIFHTELRQGRMIDLYLNEIDIHYVDRRFTLPTIHMPLILSAQELNLIAATTSRYAVNNRREWKIYLVAPDEVIENINCVEYTLHPTFHQRIWNVCRDENFDFRYPFSSPGTFEEWGTFNVLVKVFFRNGNICIFDRMLIFKE